MRQKQRRISFAKQRENKQKQKSPHFQTEQSHLPVIRHIPNEVTFAQATKGNMDIETRLDKVERLLEKLLDRLNG